MSFTYLNPPNFQIDVIRALIADTDSAQPIFQNEELYLFYAIQGSCFQSSMFFSGSIPVGGTTVGGQTIPYQPMSYLRVAALALDSMAANKAYLASIKRLPDVQLDSSDAAKMLMAKADSYRKVEDESGAYFIIEQVTTIWSFTDRYWSQIQRQTGV